MPSTRRSAKSEERKVRQQQQEQQAAAAQKRQKRIARALVTRDQALRLTYEKRFKSQHTFEYRCFKVGNVEGKAVWATLDKEDNLKFRSQSKPGVAASRYAKSEFSYTFSASADALRPLLIDRRGQVAAIKLLATGSYGLTKIEVDLVFLFQDCWAYAVQMAIGHNLFKPDPHIPYFSGRMPTALPDKTQNLAKEGSSLCTELLSDWQQEEYFQNNLYPLRCKEAIAAGAKYLLENWGHLPGWFKNAKKNPTKLGTFIEIFLVNFHRAVVVSDKKYCVLDSLDVDLISNGKLLPTNEDDYNNIDEMDAYDSRLKSMKDLEKLSYGSPISRIMVSASKRSSKSIDIDTPNTADPHSLEAADQALVEHEHHAPWIKHFFNSDTGNEMELKLTGIPTVLFRGGKSQTSREISKTLKEGANELRQVRHWQIVHMLWNKVIIPRANANEEEIVKRTIADMLVMAQGKLPTDIGTADEAEVELGIKMEDYDSAYDDDVHDDDR